MHKLATVVAENGARGIPVSMKLQNYISRNSKGCVDFDFISSSLQ